MIQLLPLEVVYQTGFNLYAVVRGVVAGTRQYWNPTLNTGAGGWEPYNSAHWAQYAIALTEDTQSGYYAAAFPAAAAVAGIFTSETFYVRAGGSPVLADVPAAGLAHTQGESIKAIAGDVQAADNAQQAFLSEQLGAAAGVPTASVVPTNLTAAQMNAYAGRAVVFTSGAAFQAVARIVAYNPTGGVLTFAAPLPVAPAAADSFVII